MTPKEFGAKMKNLAHKYFYKEDKDLSTRVVVSYAFVQAVDLMVVALAENGFDEGIFQYKNFIEE
jgi:hypothetical protein